MLQKCESGDDTVKTTLMLEKAELAMLIDVDFMK